MNRIPLNRLQYTGSREVEELTAAFAEIHQLEYAVENSVDRPHLRRCQIFVPSEEADHLRQTLVRFWEGYSGWCAEPEPVPDIRIKPVRDDWRTAWRRFFRGRQVTPLWYIAPPWETPDQYSGTLLSVDAGPAFGTGHHPTTVLCLELMALVPGRERRFLDAGSGSGILSIAAAVSSGDSSFGFDRDPDAASIAASNAERNCVDSMVEFVTGSWDCLGSRQFDYAAVNMLPVNFTGSLDILRGAVKPDGYAVFSGIVGHERDALIRVLEEHGFLLLEELQSGDWFGFLCRRKSD